MRAMTDTLLWLTAIGSVATAAFTAFLWLVAWRTLSGAKDQLELLTQQAVREVRPFVSAEVLPGFHGTGCWDLVVSNSGRTAARNIRFEIEPWSPGDDKDHISEPLNAYLRAQHMLVPGARHRVMWRMNTLPELGLTEAGAGAQASLGIRYEDDLGQTYTDAFLFNLDIIGAITPSPSEGPSALGKDKELANIERALRTLNVHVGELRR